MSGQPRFTTALPAGKHPRYPLKRGLWGYRAGLGVWEKSIFVLIYFCQELTSEVQLRCPHITSGFPCQSLIYTRVHVSCSSAPHISGRSDSLLVSLKQKAKEKFACPPCCYTVILHSAQSEFDKVAYFSKLNLVHNL
jgi:hypothetical protein